MLVQRHHQVRIGQFESSAVLLHNQPYSESHPKFNSFRDLRLEFHRPTHHPNPNIHLFKWHPDPPNFLLVHHLAIANDSLYQSAISNIPAHDSVCIHHTNCDESTAILLLRLVAHSDYNPIQQHCTLCPLLPVFHLFPLSHQNHRCINDVDVPDCLLRHPHHLHQGILSRIPPLPQVRELQSTLSLSLMPIRLQLLFLEFVQFAHCNSTGAHIAAFCASSGR